MLAAPYGRPSRAAEKWAAAVAVQSYSAPQAAPARADLLEGLGSDPLLQCRLPDGEQLVASALPLGAHDRTPRLVACLSAATARDGFYALDLIAHGFVEDGVGQGTPARPCMRGGGVSSLAVAWTEYAGRSVRP